MNYQYLIEETIKLIDEENRVISNIENDENYFRSMPSMRAYMIQHHKQFIDHLIEDIKFMQKLI